ncbi:MAG: hypothetical protein E7315_00485 [Clostridiales bacterium]|nr:hypothetical protein [Clostridiales bacterium]
MKLNIKESLSDKKFRYGGISTLLVAVLIVVVIVINLVISYVPLSVDTTANKYYTISSKTQGVLDKLKDTVHIYGLYEIGYENADVVRLLERYDEASDKIEYKTVDPVVNPQFTIDFMEDKNSPDTRAYATNVIVSYGDRFKVLTEAEDLYRHTYDESGEIAASTLNVEQAVTNAIVSVTAQKNYTITMLSGHGEMRLPEDYEDKLEKTYFYDLEWCDLKNDGFIPAETDILIVNQPMYDLMDDEKEEIMKYLQGYGDAIFIMGRATADTPNFDEVMNYYGIRLGKEVIYEEDSSMWFQVKNAIMPEYKIHSATLDVFASEELMLVNAKPIKTNAVLKTGVTVTELCHTSDKSWASLKFKDAMMQKEDGDIDGPFAPIVGITDSGFSMSDSTAVETRLFVVNCAQFLVSGDVALNIYSNDDFFFSAISWVLNEDSLITIVPKTNVVATHTMSNLALYVVSVIIGIVIPVGILATGLTVYLKRRHL